MTNKKFAKTNQEFIELCQSIDIKPTKRQASKYRMGKGKAFKAKK